MKYRRLPLSSVFNLSILTLLLVSPTIQAAEMPPMDSANMQDMMLKMNQMQSCLSAIDPEKFDQAEQAMTQAQNEITQSCQQQKRDLAQQQAIRFYKFLQQSETLDQIALCSQPMHSFLPSMPLMEQNTESLAKQNICDTMSNP